jgi:hypothetical protein
MTTEQHIQIIDTLLPILYEYRAIGQAKVSADASETLKSIYAEIFGVYNIDSRCPSCVINYLYMLEAYRDKAVGEIQRLTEVIELTGTAVEEVIIPEAATTQELIEKVKTSKKPKSCCKNK